VLGRMTKKTVPKQAEDGRGDLVTTYAYAGRTTTIQVCGSADSGTANCLNLDRTTDSLGRYVETRDALNGRTRFWYEANGNVAAIEDANGVVTKASYNAIGQRTGVVDPNQGTWSFAYNALGEVTQQTDARAIVTTMSYDKLGRPVARSASVDVTGDNVADAVADSWSYDPANAKGVIGSSQRTINGQIERSTTTTYDALSRPVQTSVTQALSSGTGSYPLRTKYDSYYGRPIGQSFPNGEAVQVLYSVRGHAIAEKDPGTGIEYRRLDATNARGQTTQETFGNGVTLTPTYQAQTGQLTGLGYSKSGSSLRQLGYGYDVFGNLKRQSLDGNASREDYSYDQLHRLVQSIRSGAASGTVSYGFDAVGNLTKKSDFSSNTANAYSYSGGSCGGGANAVKTVALAAGGSRTYCYDANGNLTGDNAGLSIQYDHQNLPTKATRGAQTDWFRYGADGMRTRSWGADGSKVYLPGYEHRPDTGETKVYVGDYAVISKIGATRKVEYLLKDRLGSVDAVTNASGAVIETRGYDAYGKPRSGTWNDLTPAKLQSTNVTPKGFTQHEHLNQLELIHMNGRAFDYNLGRFTGVDPLIQFPLNSQSLNPYSYILNNPLSGTDPSGYAACGADVKDGEVCQVEVTQKTTSRDVGSRITKTTTETKTYTIANNGGVIYATEGSGAKANAAIQSMTYGSAKDRPNGPSMQATPKKVGERPGNSFSCAKMGAGCDAEQFLYDPNEPSDLAKKVGNVIGSFGPQNDEGYRNNPLTGQPVPNPMDTRMNTVGNVLAFVMLGRIPLGNGPRIAASAEERADLALKMGRTSGAAAELVVGGRVFTDVSTNELRAFLPEMQAALARVQNKAPWHGQCAEMGCLDQALRAGINPAGGVSRAVGIGTSRPGHGVLKMTCSSCQGVLKEFGVNYVY
jgi:RHS repeat-associated protein